MQPTDIYGVSSFNAVSEVILPEDVPEGLYLLNLVSDHLDDQLLVVYTCNALVVKNSPELTGGGEIMAWVSDLNDFAVAGAKISVYDLFGRIITTGLTDAQGVYRGRIPAGEDAKLVVARNEGSISICGIR